LNLEIAPGADWMRFPHADRRPIRLKTPHLAKNRSALAAARRRALTIIPAGLAERAMISPIGPFRRSGTR
jgi:hypothetical protein